MLLKTEKSHLMNPDSRPLPPGWNEHYDAGRQAWYYVLLDGQQPKVSFTHPVDSLPEYCPPSIQASLPSPPSRVQTAALPQRTQNFSFAQQLYASALSKNAPASPSQITQQPRPTSLPTPPPSNSPPPRRISPTLPSIPTPPIVNRSNSMQDARPSTEFYNSVIPSRQPRPVSGVQPSFAFNASPSINETLQPATPQKRIPFQASLPDRQSVFHHRASTMPAGPTSGPTGGRHLVTTARPPPLAHTYSASGPPTTAGIMSPGLHRPQTSVSSTTPTTPVSNVQGALSPPTSFLSPTTPITYLPSPVSSHSTASSPTLPTHSPSGNQGNQTGQVLVEIGKSVAKTLGKAALQTAGKAIKNMFFGADTVADIVTSFAGISTDQLGVGILQLEAVLQGSVTADYQSVINALLRLQHRPNLQPQQLAHPINYPALIAKLQKAQEMANAQLQQLQLLAQQQQQQLQALQNPGATSPPTLAQYQAQYQQQLVNQQQQQHTPAITPAPHSPLPSLSPTYQPQSPGYQSPQQQQPQLQQQNIQAWIQQQQHQAQQNFAQQLEAIQQAQQHPTSPNTFQHQTQNQVHQLIAEQMHQQQQQAQAQIQAILQQDQPSQQLQPPQSQEAQFQAALDAQQAASLYPGILPGQSQPPQSPLTADSMQGTIDTMSAFGASYDLPPPNEDPPPFDPLTLYQNPSLGNFDAGISSVGDGGLSNLMGSFSSSMLSDPGTGTGLTDTFANLGTSFDASSLVSSWTSDS